jgi:hypothetical protein
LTRSGAAPRTGQNKRRGRRGEGVQGGDAAREEEERGEDEEGVEVDGPEPERERHGGPQRRVGRAPEHDGAVLRPLPRGRLAVAIADAIRPRPHRSASGKPDARRED